MQDTNHLGHRMSVNMNLQKFVKQSMNSPFCITFLSKHKNRNKTYERILRAFATFQIFQSFEITFQRPQSKLNLHQKLEYSRILFNYGLSYENIDRPLY